MFILPNQSRIVYFVNERGNNEETYNTTVPYRNFLYEQYREVESAGQLTQDDIEEIFSCLISKNIFSDPVITPTGHTYERVCIEAWVDANHTDPISREPLTKEALRPNNALKALVVELVRVNEMLQSRPRGFVPERRTLQDVLDDFKQNLANTFSLAATIAVAPALMSADGSQQCSEGNTLTGAASIAAGTVVGAGYAVSPVPVAAAIGGAAAIASVAVTTEACVDASTVISQQQDKTLSYTKS